MNIDLLILKEEKLKLVLLHLNEKVSLMQIEKEYSVSNGLVSTWVKKYLNGGEEALVSRSGNPYAALHTSKSLSEVERLRLIVAKQEIEIARLKPLYEAMPARSGTFGTYYLDDRQVEMYCNNTCTRLTIQISEEGYENPEEPRILTEEEIEFYTAQAKNNYCLELWGLE